MPCFTTNITFPLTGSLSDITIGLEFIIIFFCIECFIFFLLRFFQSTEKIREKRNLAWGIFFLGFGMVYAIYCIGDYIVTTTQERDLVSMGGYTMLALTATIMLVVTESVEHTRKRILSILCSITLLINLICLLLDQRSIAILTAFLGVPLAIIYFAGYLRKLLRLANYSRSVIYRVMEFFFGAMGVLIGYTLISDIFVETYGIIIRIIADAITILGLNIFLLAIDHLPDFREFDWIKKIRALIVVESNGISLFSRFYEEGTEQASQEFLISGALSSVDSVLKAMVGKEQLNTVILPDKAILFEYREKMIFAVIADEELLSLHVRLKQFADKFDSIFKEILPTWNGNLNAFAPAEIIADTIFLPRK